MSHKWRFELVFCVRCRRGGKLHLRDDVSVPSVWYCRLCRRVNKQEIHLLEMIERHSGCDCPFDVGRKALWERRLEVHRKLNRVGATVYRKYWEDESTHGLMLEDDSSSGVDL